MKKLFWLYIPLITIAVQIAFELTLPYEILLPMHGENGPIELLQFVLISLAFLVAIWTIIKYIKTASKWLLAWVSLAAICCLYVAGEEVSWGQHFLDWTTPEFWSEVNDQQETNLHNTSSWLDQKPRLILEIGVLVGGIIMPLLMKFKPSLLPARFSSIYPPSFLWVTASVAVFVKVAEKIGDSMDIVIWERGSEVIELYLFYFVLLYLITMKRRMAPQKQSKDA